MNILPAVFDVTLVVSYSVHYPLEGNELNMLAGLAIFMLVLSPLFVPVMTTIVHAIGGKRN